MIKCPVDLYTCWPVLYLPVGTVVQCPLHPLGGGSHQWILYQTDQMSRQSTAPLTPHRVTLIRHSTGTYNQSTESPDNQRTESPEKTLSISSTCNLLALLKLIFFSKSTESESYFQWTNFDTSKFLDTFKIGTCRNTSSNTFGASCYSWEFFCEIQKHWSHWPIWSFSNGSSSSLKLANSLISVQIYKTWPQLKSMVFVKM